jgi:hypothetical protein
VADPARWPRGRNLALEAGCTLQLASTLTVDLKLVRVKQHGGKTFFLRMYEFDLTSAVGLRAAAARFAGPAR